MARTRKCPQQQQSEGFRGQRAPNTRDSQSRSLEPGSLERGEPFQRPSLHDGVEDGIVQESLRYGRGRSRFQLVLRPRLLRQSTGATWGFLNVEDFFRVRGWRNGMLNEIYVYRVRFRDAVSDINTRTVLVSYYSNL